MRTLSVILSAGLASAFSPGIAPIAPSLVSNRVAAPLMFGGATKAAPKKAVVKKAPVKKAPVKKAPAKAAPAKKVPAKKVPAKKVPAKKVPAKKVPARKAPVTKFKPKPTSGGTFAYGLPGNFNIIGGGEARFDPYGFLDGKSKLEVNRYRECELTHGRVGMLASLGFIVQEKFHPLFDGVGGPAIDQIPQLPFALWFSMGMGITFCEFYRIQIAFRELDQKMLKAETAIRPGYEPGQIGFDPLNLAPSDPKEFRLMQEKELAHARIAMVAAAIFLLQEGITKQTWGTAWGVPEF